MGSGANLVHLLNPQNMPHFHHGDPHDKAALRFSQAHGPQNTTAVRLEIAVADQK